MKQILILGQICGGPNDKISFKIKLCGTKLAEVCGLDARINSPEYTNLTAPPILSTYI